MNKHVLFPLIVLCILVGAIYLTVVLISPPTPLPVDAPATEFSAGRAMQDLEVIAREPHPIGISAGHMAVRDYLLVQIRLLGLEPQLHKTISARVIQPGFLISGSVENILVRPTNEKPGLDNSGADRLM